jgi:hypothetical protein
VVDGRLRRDQGCSVGRGYEDTVGWWEYGISSVRSVVLTFPPNDNVLEAVLGPPEGSHPSL